MKILWPLLAVIVLLTLLAGCATPCKPIIKTQYQHVDVPIAVRATPPDELLEPIVVPNDLIFVSPTDARASSALTADGEAALTSLINEYAARLAAWHAWAAE